MLQRCAACERHVFYPRVLCPHCSSGSLEWVAASGQGTVHSVTVVQRRVEDGGPYNVVLVDLDEGVRMMSRVEGIAHEQVRIGQRVTHVIRECPDGPLVCFVPA